jgi:hypothetical protein
MHGYEARLGFGMTRTRNQISEASPRTGNTREETTRTNVGRPDGRRLPGVFTPFRPFPVHLAIAGILRLKDGMATPAAVELSGRLGALRRAKAHYSVYGQMRPPVNA